MVPNRLVCASLLLLPLLLAASPGRGLTPSLVKDIDPETLSLGSVPLPFLSLANGLTLFLADGVETGRELWRSDGTAEGTWRLLDACTGPCSFQYSFFGPAEDRAFFVTSEHGPGDLFGSLWVTSGAPAGTILLAEELRILEHVPPVWVAELDLLFFVASDGEHGFELWRSDGTAAGTRMVRDLAPGIESSQTMELTTFQGRLYFVAIHPEHGPALWMSNGTPGGTRMIRDPWAGRSDHHAPAFLRVVGSLLCFFAPSPSFGFDLWRSDGSRAGTVPVLDLVSGRDDLKVAGAAVAGGRLYFVADDGAGEELWASNGNVRGTRRLTDLANPFAFSTGQLQLPVPAPGGRAAFLAGDETHGQEPWLTNGTPAGTRRLDLCPGPCSSRAVLDQVHAGRLYFAADDGTRGLEPWVSDGTVAGTRLLRNLCPGSCSSNPDFLQPVRSQLLLTADRVGAAGTRLLRTDGTSTGTIGIAAFPVPLVPLEQAGAVPGALLFPGWDPEHGVELWRTDATPAGTRLVEDLQGIVPAGSSPALLTSVGDRLRFVARTRDGDALHIGFWESDGSAAGTVPRGGAISQVCLNETYLLATLPDGDPLFACDESYVQRVLWRGVESGPVRLTAPEVSVIPFGRAAAVLGSTVFFSAMEPGHGSELWKTDGTPEGTVRVKELLSGHGDAVPYGFTVFQGRVFFFAWSDQTNGTGLWSTDGTEEGTQLLLPADAIDFLNLLDVHGGRLWFAARARNGGDRGFELWSTDGTMEGTVEFDLAPGRADLAPFRLISAGSRMFFAGTEGGQGLWVSDGTREGSRRIGDRSLLPHADGDAALVGERLFYRSFEDDVLWQSDGTAAGTGPVPGPDGEPIAGARDLTAFAGQLFFLWQDAIWRTDGTAAGIFRVEGDFRAPGELTVVGARLFFRATDTLYGSELWALEP